MQKNNFLRLYINAPLKEGAKLSISGDDFHYLINVMRIKSNDRFKIFNENDGEFLANITHIHKKLIYIEIVAILRHPVLEPELNLIFAITKSKAMELVVEKGTELGVTNFYPIITDFTVIKKLNLARCSRIIKEACEQSERNMLAKIHEPVTLKTFFSKWNKKTLFCCERDTDIIFINNASSEYNSLLVGPEGGFSDMEKQYLKSCEFIMGISMGKRILRAETASIAAISAFQAIWGDWQNV